MELKLQHRQLLTALRARVQHAIEASRPLNSTSGVHPSVFDFTKQYAAHYDAGKLERNKSIFALLSPE